MASTTYIKANEDARTMLDALIERTRPDLIEAGGKVGFLFAFGADDKPAIKVRGSVVLGRCKINGLQDRVEGKPDVTITVDGERWERMTARQQEALLAHELAHIELWDPEEHGHDDLDRPKLKSRYGDIEFDLFHEVIRRYGVDAPEAANLIAVLAAHPEIATTVAADGKAREPVGVA